MTVQTAEGFAALPKTSAPGSPLTVRQRQILTLVARGLSNEEVGRELHVSHATVATMVRKILAKLAVPNRQAAVNRGWELGLLGPAEGVAA